MQYMLKKLHRWPVCFYIVAQQTPHGASLDSGRGYESADLADQEVAYWHKEKCNWMKRFRVDIETDVEDYMKPK